MRPHSLFLQGCLLIVALLFFSGGVRDCAAEQPEGQPPTADSSAEDQGKSADQLIEDAQHLFAEKRPIDARVKLQRALALAPEDYRPHMYLGVYYLSEVGHFLLADRYIRTAQALFAKRYGKDEVRTAESPAWRDHARLLFLRSESLLNLDNYEASLRVLDVFGRLYWDDWYPGQRAWVLMKLKRIDEAIRVAQAGLLRGGEPSRTYNILGILFSMKGNRPLALDAFKKAVESEIQFNGAEGIATPLNNTGEVYREMFQDDLAEAAWLKTVQLPDGCEHILPSLNLSILYVDQLRLFQAERVLNDFEACFANKILRQDTEHRALLALARGRLALRMGNPEKAIDYLTLATQRQQWYGKIGTNESDVRVAALVSLSQALSAQASVLADRRFDSVWERLAARVQSPLLQVRAWWANRRAREVGIDELGSFEDFYIRNTDAMLEYTTLGSLFAGIPTESLQKRLKRMEQPDLHPVARAFFDLYLAENSLSHGAPEAAEQRIEQLLGSLRDVDRLARAQALTDLALALRDRRGFFGSPDSEQRQQEIALREDIFALLPSNLRYAGLALPVRFRAAQDGDEKIERMILRQLPTARFEDTSALPGIQSRYEISIRTARERASEATLVSITLRDTRANAPVASVEKTITASEEGSAAIINAFLDKAFSHQADFPGDPIPRLELLENVLEPSPALP